MGNSTSPVQHIRRAACLGEDLLLFLFSMTSFERGIEPMGSRLISASSLD
jgi:hypothetical protein